MKTLEDKITEWEEIKEKIYNNKAQRNNSRNQNIENEVDTYAAFDIDHPSKTNPFYVDSGDIFDDEDDKEIKNANYEIAKLRQLIKYKEIYKEWLIKQIESYDESFILILFEAISDVFLSQILKDEIDESFIYRIKNSFFEDLLKMQVNKMEIDLISKVVVFDKNPKQYKCKSNESLLKLIKRALEDNIERATFEDIKALIEQHSNKSDEV
ncbi:MAG: hypothetical protein KDB74_08335 [Flavobacteriales bacterium]|nr:hypothetical protein [Flavobacteriales bacterium]